MVYKRLMARLFNRRPSLLRTLMVQIGLVVVVGGILINFLFFSIAYYADKRDFNDYIALSSRQLADTFTQQLWLFDVTTTQQLCHMAVESGNISGIRLFDHTHHLIAESGSFNCKDAIKVWQILTYQGKNLVGYMEVLFVNKMLEKRLVFNTMAAGCMVLFTAAASFALILLLLTRHLVRPLQQLHRDMRQVTSGAFTGSKMTGQKAEIQALVDGFNQMAAALEIRQRSKQQAEQQLFREKAVMEAIIQTLPGIFFVHVKGEGLVRWNDNFQALSGLAFDQIRGKSVEYWIDPADRPEFLEKLETALKEDTPGREFEADFCLKNGRVPYLLSARQCRIQEQDVTIGLGIDLLERKRLEDSLRRAHKMESIGTLAGGIAHDFNNILFPLLGYANMLKEDLPDGSFQKEAVDAICQAGLRAEALVKQILTLSRHQEQELIPLKIQTILKEVIRLLEASIPKTIRIDKSIDTSCGLVVADPTQIHQIIMNLGTNAFHAMENTGGVLSFSLQPVNIPGPQYAPVPLSPGSYVLVKVKDTGTGIEPAHADRIFDPYFTTKPLGRGTGLGLSIVQGIVRRYRGEIYLQSEQGKGTEVSIYLPVAESPNSVLATQVQTEVLSGEESILIVDDEAAVLEIIKNMLQRQGYKVTAIQEPLKALDLIAKDPNAFDLVITDMTMPGMTGVQLTSRLKRLRPNLPVILCSGFSDQINAENSATFNIQAYLEKPVSKEEISRSIRRVLENQLSVPPTG